MVKLNFDRALAMNALALEPQTTSNSERKVDHFIVSIDCLHSKERLDWRLQRLNTDR
jgi:hypothetical protein